MAESWPSGLVSGVSRVEMYLQRNVSRSVSPISRTVQELQRQGKRWIATIDVDGDRIVGQLMDALLDRGDSFLVYDFTRPYPYNGLITGVLVNGAHLRGDATIAIDGLPISQTWLKAGDYLGIGGKLYRLTADITANGAGQGTASLNRGLLADAADNAVVNLDKPTCEMFLADDDQARRAVDGNHFYQYSVSFVESP